MKKFIKSNIKELIAFTLGAVIFGTTVYAATVSSSYVSYSNSSSKLTSTNVQGAIDEIDRKADKWLDLNFISSNIDFDTMKTNPRGTILASSKGVCIERNNKVSCIKPGNYGVEKNHMQQIFSDVGCYEEAYSNESEGEIHYYTACDASDIHCVIYRDTGTTMCVDQSDGSLCSVRPSAEAYCDRG